MTLKEISIQLKKVKSAAVFCHMRPDGDALGAAMGLSWMLSQLGARCCVVCESGIPVKFRFLEGMDTIQKQPPEDVETYIAVDSSDEHRLGALCDVFIRAKRPSSISIIISQIRVTAIISLSKIVRRLARSWQNFPICSACGFLRWRRIIC